MAGFVHERVRRLNASLSRYIREQDALGVTSNDTNNELSIAIRDIDLSTTTLPKLDMIAKCLDDYLSSRSSSTDSTMDKIFMVKCTIAIYGIVLSDILHATLPLSEAISYWNSIYGSLQHELYYALQTVPWRMFRLARRSVHKLRTTEIGIQALASSHEHVLSSLFPLYTTKEPAPFRKTQHRSFHLSLALSSRTWVGQLIHEEIGHRRRALTHHRSQLAVRLGLLMAQPPLSIDDTTSSVHSSLFLSACKAIYVLQQVVVVRSTGEMGDIDGTLLDVINRRLGEDRTMDVRAMIHALSDIVDVIPAFQECMEQAQEAYGIPSTIERYWLPSVTGMIAGQALLRFGFKYKQDLVTWIEEAALTVRDFAIHWVYEPMVKVWDTVRLKDQRLRLLSKDSLRSDLESLERMVVDFARDHQVLDHESAESLCSKVREGDMSLVLRAYEHEIKQPLRNALLGDLIQTLLIQVQKTKVDVDLATTALDKLLKSNELNFAFLAVAPSMLLLWATINGLRNSFQRRSGKRLMQKSQPIRETLRRVERLFNLSSDRLARQSYQSQGILLCEVFLLRTYAQFLPKGHAIRDHFIEDLRDLENTDLTVQQKLQTLDRMRHTWSFLHAG